MLTKTVNDAAARPRLRPEVPDRGVLRRGIRDIRVGPFRVPQCRSRVTRGASSPPVASQSLRTTPHSWPSLVRWTVRIVIRTNSPGSGRHRGQEYAARSRRHEADNVATRNGAFGVQRFSPVHRPPVAPDGRSDCVAPSDGGTTTPNPGSGGTGTPPASTSTAVASAASVVSLAGTSPVATPRRRRRRRLATAKLASAKLLVIKGKRYLVLRPRARTRPPRSGSSL